MTSQPATALPGAITDRRLFHVKLSSPDGSSYEGPAAARTTETALVLLGACARRAGMLITGDSEVTIYRVWHTMTPAGETGADIRTDPDAPVDVAVRLAAAQGYRVVDVHGETTIVIAGDPA